MHSSIEGASDFISTQNRFNRRRAHTTGDIGIANEDGEPVSTTHQRAHAVTTLAMPHTSFETTFLTPRLQFEWVNSHLQP